MHAPSPVGADTDRRSQSEEQECIPGEWICKEKGTAVGPQTASSQAHRRQPTVIGNQPPGTETDSIDADCVAVGAADEVDAASRSPVTACDQELPRHPRTPADEMSSLDRRRVSPSSLDSPDSRRQGR